MIATANAFPPLHAFNSSRSWFLAAIVLLHLGFFWVLTNGLTVGSVQLVPKGTIVLVPAQPKPQPPPTTPVEPPTVRSTAYVPPIDVPQLPRVEEGTSLEQVTHDPPPIVPKDDPGPGSADPVILGPQIDPRVGLTEPVYPVDQIRMQHEGTVVLSVQVLLNGRIGGVRIERSSGYARLDEAAVREARRWRLIPGTRDGAAVDMWKEIPITFRLRD